MMGRFSEEYEILDKASWADLEGIKDALEWHKQGSKEEQT